MKWIQHVINNCPDELNGHIKSYLDDKNDLAIEWLSPRVDDDYAEYL